jgi:hypothetical protein
VAATTLKLTSTGILNASPLFPPPGLSSLFAPPTQGSFGVVLWEIASRLTPYMDFKNAWSVRTFVQDGGRPPRPADCVDVYWGLVEACWDNDPMARPTFGEALGRLERMGRSSTFVSHAGIVTP